MTMDEPNEDLQYFLNSKDKGATITRKQGNSIKQT
jgi:hypothetical protein